ncbi:MAG: hypothetical protein IJ193_06100 [Bacilli bacterium]|nr:hypothetical protein [Bacilli bacterium]
MEEKFNSKSLKVINDVIKKDKVPHAMLFEVDDCDSAMNFVKNVAKLTLCKEKDKSLQNLNCGKCNICNLIDTDNYPDFMVISTDSNWIKKQQLMDLQEEFNNKSLFDNKRIYVIKQADKLNTSSENSLLKFLEEPADDIIAILLTENRYLLLDTIISRCQIYNLKSNNINIDDEIKDKVENLIEYFSKKRNLFIYYKDIFDNVLPDKATAIKVLSEIEKYFVYYLSNINNIDYNDTIFQSIRNIEVEDMVSYVKIIENEKQKLEYNVNYKIWVDSFFSRIIGEVYD